MKHDPEKFKLGFYRGLAKMGFTPSEFQDILNKRASMDKSALGGGSALASTLLKLLGVGLLSAPALVGGTMGGGAHAMLGSEARTLEDAKAEELETTYRSAAKKIRDRQKRKLTLQRGGNRLAQGSIQ